MGAVDPRLRAAVDASIGWYEDLTALHGVPSRVADGLWMSIGPPPPLHSDVAVVEPHVSGNLVDRALADRPTWGFKDSFATIRPSGSDVRLLFAATWIHRAPAHPSGAAPRRWIRVNDPAWLADWTAHHDTADVLLPGILDRGHFAVLERRTDGIVTGGAVVRLGTGIADLSNVHAVAGHDVDWGELAADVEALFPDRGIVGYERDDALQAARAGGFETVGELRVWVR
jgi:hypothetical protein